MSGRRSPPIEAKGTGEMEDGMKLVEGKQGRKISFKMQTKMINNKWRMHEKVYEILFSCIFLVVLLCSCL